MRVVLWFYETIIKARPTQVTKCWCVDYGLAWKFMPKLSFVEKLLLQSFTVFGHLFKTTSASGVSIKGALIALRTDAKEIMLQRKKLEEDRFNNVPVLLPRRTINMDIQFLGKLYMWTESNLNLQQD